MSAASCDTNERTELGRSAAARRRRGGLAPLELVLWLPVLLMVAALMVVLGTMTAWRVRGEVVSRDAVWRTRWPRSGADEPAPPAWPVDATMGVAGDAPLQPDPDPTADHPVVRGPRFMGYTVNDLLGTDQGERLGTASVVRQFPLLRPMGPYESGTIGNPLLDNQLQFTRMGRSRNLSMRLNSLYQEMGQLDARQFAPFNQSVQRLLSDHRLQKALQVLDHDHDFLRYPFCSGSPPDFHPSAGVSCTDDPEEIRDRHVDPLIAAIRRVPETMKNSFLALYRCAVRELERRNGNPAEIAKLKQYIEQLEAFQP